MNAGQGVFIMRRSRGKGGRTGMNFWNGAADLKVMILGSVVISLFAIYVCMKIYCRKYLFSVFNIGIFTEIFMVFIIPFMYEDKAWLAFGKDSAEPFYAFLNQNLKINLTGMIIFYVVLIVSEFQFVPRKSIVCGIIGRSVDTRVIWAVFYTAIIGWYLIVFLYNGTLPLLNGERDFYKKSRIANVLYILFNSSIPLLTVYFGFLSLKAGNVKNIFCFLMGASACLFSGNRSDLLLKIVFPLMLIVLYKHGKNRINSTVKICAGIGFILIAGLGISLLRSRGNTGPGAMLQEFIYGNTFCDFRDGAFVLYGYHNQFDDFLYGKTYIAGLISFIPSFLSEFKQTWGWGYFSTDTLLNMPNHYGLRGGTYCEPYLNFGYVGIIICAVVQARWLAYREGVFDRYLKGEVSDFGKKYLIISLAQPVFQFVVSSNGLRTFYINFLVLAGAAVLLKGLIWLSNKQKSEG